MAITSSGKHTVEPTAFFIHGRIHRANPRAQCVLHTHMPYATALTIIDGGELAWASQNALRFHGRVAYDRDYNGLALSDAEGDRMAAKLRDADVLFLANHGVIVCGASVAYAFDDLYYLERACMLQVLAHGKRPAAQDRPGKDRRADARANGCGAPSIGSAPGGMAADIGP